MRNYVIPLLAYAFLAPLRASAQVVVAAPSPTQDASPQEIELRTRFLSAVREGRFKLAHSLLTRNAEITLYDDAHGADKLLRLRRVLLKFPVKEIAAHVDGKPGGITELNCGKNSMCGIDWGVTNSKISSVGFGYYGPG